jgi:hypothetical protein
MHSAYDEDHSAMPVHDGTRGRNHVQKTLGMRRCCDLAHQQKALQGDLQTRAQRWQECTKADADASPQFSRDICTDTVIHRHKYTHAHTHTHTNMAPNSRHAHVHHVQVDCEGRVKQMEEANRSKDDERREAEQVSIRQEALVPRLTDASCRKHSVGLGNMSLLRLPSCQDFDCHPCEVPRILVQMFRFRRKSAHELA